MRVPSLLYVLIVISTYQLISGNKSGNSNSNPCSDVQGAYIQGISMNKSIVITKVPRNPNAVINDICVVANTQDVFLLSAQFTLSPNIKSMQSLNNEILLNLIVLSIEIFLVFYLNSLTSDNL